MIELRNLSNKNDLNFANTGKIMRFEVVADSGSGAGSISGMPATLDDGGAVNAPRGAVATMKLTPDMAVAKRTLKVLRANGQWTITNASGGRFHPLHIQLIDAKIIGRNTNGGKPFGWETGPEDVFYAGETSRSRR